MNATTQSIILVAATAILSGAGATILRAIFDQKTAKRQEQIHFYERQQDQLKIELKDLKIQLYDLEKDLNEWKHKYYEAVTQFIEVKAELEHTIVSLTLIEAEHHYNDDHSS